MTVHQPPTFLSANDTTSLKFQLVCCTAMGWTKFRKFVVGSYAGSIEWI
jgi:hypothetical protein